MAFSFTRILLAEKGPVPNPVGFLTAHEVIGHMLCGLSTGASGVSIGDDPLEKTGHPLWTHRHYQACKDGNHNATDCPSDDKISDIVFSGTLLRASILQFFQSPR